MSLLATARAQAWKYGCLACAALLLMVSAHDIYVMLDRATTKTALAKAQGDLKARTTERDALLASNQTNADTIDLQRKALEARVEQEREQARLNAEAIASLEAQLKDADAAARYANEQLAKGYRNPDCAAKLRLDLSCAL
jgi:peptidoglycan hydrolase CwlO-like protein